MATEADDRAAIRKALARIEAYVNPAATPVLAAVADIREIIERQEQPPSGATIRDVARLAQVCQKTVSRVLNHEAYVTQETRDKVQAAMRQLDYRPNEAARSLRLGVKQS